MKALVKEITDKKVKIKCENCNTEYQYKITKASQGRYTKVCLKCEETMEFEIDREEFFRGLEVE